MRGDLSSVPPVLSLTPVTGVWRRESDITRRAAKKLQDTHTTLSSTLLARLTDYTHSTHDTNLNKQRTNSLNINKATQFIISASFFFLS